MSDEGNVVSVESGENEVFVGGPNSQVVETPEPKVENEPKTFDADYVKSLREEAARHRVEKQKEAAARQELETKLQEYEDAKLSTEERASREFEETKARASKFEQLAKEAVLKYQLATAAQEHGLKDVNAAVKLADRELIQTDENGNISNIEEIVGALKNEYKALFATAPSAPHTGVTNPAKPAGTKKWTREDLAKMSPERRVELLAAGEFKHLL